MHTCIYNNGRNNIQLNFLGTKEKAIESFQEDMKRTKAVWGHLFDVRNGNLVSSYSEEHKKMSLIKNLTNLDFAISNGKDVFIKNKKYNIWEKFDHESYVLRDIVKYIEDGVIAFVI